MPYHEFCTSTHAANTDANAKISTRAHVQPARHQGRVTRGVSTMGAPAGWTQQY